MNWIILIYFFSGVCSLIDEVIWVRLLKLTLGNTVYASSVVVSVFMGGLALGAFIMARWADRIKNRLKLYALLELIITISALSVPWLLRLTDGGYAWLFQKFQLAHWQLLIVQVIFSAVLLLIPTVVMGATLPLLGRFVTSVESRVGQLVGRLYALNMLGAAAGCFLAGFVFIRIFGVMGTLYIAAGINLFVALGGWILSLRQEISPGEQEILPPSDSIENRRIGFKFCLLVAAFFMSGLISIAYEIIWMRSIVHLVGGATYVFSSVLTVYLLGNVIGVGIGSRISKRLKTPAIGFGISLSFVGLLGIIYLPFLDVWASKMLPAIETVFGTGRMHSQSTSNIMFGPFLHCTFLFIIPSIVMGIGFPIALQAWTNWMHKVGKSTGTAYGANTIGAVAGGIIAGFVLIPFLGVQFSMTLLGLTGIWIGCLLCLLFLSPSRIMLRLVCIALASIVTISAIKAPPDLFNKIVTKKHTYPGHELLAVKEGVTTTVSVHQRDEGTYLYSSGQMLAGDSPVVQSDQKILGNFCMLLNKNATKILSVGFGTGQTTLCLSKHNPERIDCVEIAPEVVEVSLDFFSHINLGQKLNEKINMIYMDAKNYINLTDRKYDIIINDSIHPKTFAENASLYTKEYIQTAKEHLNPNGFFVSWIPTYDLNAAVYSSIIGTLAEVFPHVTMWYPTTSYAPLVLLIASEDQQIYSIKHISNKLNLENVGDELRSLNINSAKELFSCYIGDERDIKKHIKDFNINSDYFPYVEFNAEDTVPNPQIFKPFVLNMRSNSLYEHIDWTEHSKTYRDEWIREYERLYEAMGNLLKAFSTTNRLEMLLHVINGLKLIPDNSALLYTKKLTERKLFSDCIELILSGRTEDVLKISSQMLKIDPRSATAWEIRSGAALVKRDFKRAFAAGQKAVQLAPDSADSHRCLATIYLSSKQFRLAVLENEKVLQIDPDHIQALNDLAYLLSFDKSAQFYDSVRSVKLAEKLCKLTKYKKAEFLYTLTVVYAAANRLPDAISTAEEAIRLALAKGKENLAQNIKNRLKSYKADQERPN